MVARDVERLADFYTEVFGCVRLSPPQDMAGEALSRGSGIAYAETEARPVPRVNEPGYSHISFDVSDISATVEVVLAAGGSRLGEIADMDDENGVVTFVYLRDPEGNIVELMRARDNTGADLTYQEQF
jgi:predicted enzyme related to lactoylglutathione lyase